VGRVRKDSAGTDTAKNQREKRADPASAQKKYRRVRRKNKSRFPSGKPTATLRKLRLSHLARAQKLPAAAPLPTQRFLFLTEIFSEGNYFRPLCHFFGAETLWLVEKGKFSVWANEIVRMNQGKKIKL